MLRFADSATTVAVAVPFHAQKRASAEATNAMSIGRIVLSDPTPASPMTAEASAVPTTNEDALKTVLISGRPRSAWAMATEIPASGHRNDHGTSTNATASIAS